MEAVQSKHGKNRVERQRREFTRGSGGMLPREILKNAHFAYSQGYLRKK